MIHSAVDWWWNKSEISNKFCTDMELHTLSCKALTVTVFTALVVWRHHCKNTAFFSVSIKGIFWSLQNACQCKTSVGRLAPCSWAPCCTCMHYQFSFTNLLCLSILCDEISDGWWSCAFAEMLDVTKQKDLSGFYRYLYRETTGTGLTKAQDKEETEEGGK